MPWVLRQHRLRRLARFAAFPQFGIDDDQAIPCIEITRLPLHRHFQILTRCSKLAARGKQQSQTLQNPVFGHPHLMGFLQHINRFNSIASLHQGNAQLGRHFRRIRGARHRCPEKCSRLVEIPMPQGKLPG